MKRGLGGVAGNEVSDYADESSISRSCLVMYALLLTDQQPITTPSITTPYSGHYSVTDGVGYRETVVGLDWKLKST